MTTGAKHDVKMCRVHTKSAETCQVNKKGLPMSSNRLESKNSFQGF